MPISSREKGNFKTANFSGVSLSKTSVAKIAEAAKEGYLTPQKEERLGILLGRVRGGVVFISRAIVFKGGIRTRTSAAVNSRKIEARIKELTSRYRLRFLGTFHTHNEVAGSISSALSKEDKVPVSDSRLPLIEVIAAIWVSDSPIRTSKYYCQTRTGHYRIRIAAYRFGGSFPLIRCET